MVMVMVMVTMVTIIRIHTGIHTRNHNHMAREDTAARERGAMNVDHLWMAIQSGIPEISSWLLYRLWI
jgi:hypothetical protein